MDDSVAARMKTALTEHHSHGEYLLQSARMVGDLDDYMIWRSGRNAWRDTAATVISDYSTEQAMEFRKVCHVPSDIESWKRQYELELRTLQDGLELLLDWRAAIEAEESGGALSEPEHHD
jgi:hypothetical protein